MNAPWRLWGRQLTGVLRLELKKSFLSRRGWWIYLLALGPVVLTASHWLISSRGHWGEHSLAEDNRVYAGIFQVFYLRLGIFFGCVGIFANLFRGEILEKTLHYYLLSPLRRELLAISKYVAGLLTAIVFFGGSAGLSYVFIHLHYGPEFEEFLFQGPGLEQLGWYLLVAVLASIGYGAVFLVLGQWFGNPMIPAAVVMVWEAINSFLPPILKKISVIFYLKSLCPVDLPPDPHGPFLSLLTLDAEPIPAWLAIPGLLVVSGAVLCYAARRARRIEISYSE